MSDKNSRLPNDNPSALLPGTRLGEFEVLSVLGVGGFGIVYLAFDHALEREVAVKEYMPASLAGRTATLHVSVRSQSDADTFALGLRSFVNEARLLARFDHPSLLKVHQFWEANGTAYMAMPVMRGRTVKELRDEMPRPPDEAWLRALLGPLLGAIEKLHSEGVYHRDIAPDNIQIEPDGHPVLLDFGAARHVISGKTQTLTAILKPAYAPIEQYGEAGAVKQGPWTDIYALGATLHYLLLDRPPPPATARAVHDDVSALTVEACPGCSENFLRTIDWMLAPRPADRPQSVPALRDVLDGHAAPPKRRADTPQASQWDRTVVLEGPHEATTPMPRTTPPADAPARGPVDLGVDDDDRTRVLPPRASADAASAHEVPARDSATPQPGPALAAMDFAAPPVSTMQAAAPAAAAGRPKWLLPAAGGGLAALAAAAFLFWPRAPEPAGAGAASAGASAAMAAASPAAPALVTAAPAASAVPESAVATVVVPSRPPPATARPVPAPEDLKPAPEKAPAADRAQAGPEKPLPRPHAPPRPTGMAADGVPALPAPAAASAAVRPPEPSRTDKPAAPAPATAAAPASPPANAGKPAAAAGPESRCGTRTLLRYFVCMERECLRSEFASHPDCVKWRAEARRE